MGAGHQKEEEFKLIKERKVINKNWKELIKPKKIEFVKDNENGDSPPLIVMLAVPLFPLKQVTSVVLITVADNEGETVILVVSEASHPVAS